MHVERWRVVFIFRWCLNFMINHYLKLKSRWRLDQRYFNKTNNFKNILRTVQNWSHYVWNVIQLLYFRVAIMHVERELSPNSRSTTNWALHSAFVQCYQQCAVYFSRALCASSAQVLNLHPECGLRWRLWLGKFRVKPCLNLRTTLNAKSKIVKFIKIKRFNPVQPTDPSDHYLGKHFLSLFHHRQDDGNSTLLSWCRKASRSFVL